MNKTFKDFEFKTFLNHFNESLAVAQICNLNSLSHDAQAEGSTKSCFNKKNSLTFN